MALEKGNYVLKNAKNDLVLSADSAKATQNGCDLLLLDYTGANTQHWSIEPVAGETNCYFIKSAANNSLAIDGDGGAISKNGCKIQLWGSHGGDNQKWHIRVKDDNDYIIESHTQICFTPEENTNSSKVQLWSHINNKNQRWVISKV